MSKKVQFYLNTDCIDRANQSNPTQRRATRNTQLSQFNPSGTLKICSHLEKETEYCVVKLTGAFGRRIATAHRPNAALSESCQRLIEHVATLDNGNDLQHRQLARQTQRQVLLPKPRRNSQSVDWLATLDRPLSNSASIANHFSSKQPSKSEYSREGE